MKVICFLITIGLIGCSSLNSKKDQVIPTVKEQIKEEKEISKEELNYNLYTEEMHGRLSDVILFYSGTLLKNNCVKDPINQKKLAKDLIEVGMIGSRPMEKSKFKGEIMMLYLVKAIDEKEYNRRIAQSEYTLNKIFEKEFNEYKLTLVNDGCNNVISQIYFYLFGSTYGKIVLSEENFRIGMIESCNKITNFQKESLCEEIYSEYIKIDPKSHDKEIDEFKKTLNEIKNIAESSNWGLNEK